MGSQGPFGVFDVFGNKTQGLGGGLVGNVLPKFGPPQKKAEPEAESESEEEPERKSFGLLGIFEPHKAKKKPINPRELPRALFALGVSLINVNVESAGAADGIFSLLAWVPPFRHALYANAISDGMANYVCGVMYGVYSQFRDFSASLNKGQVGSLDVIGALCGCMVQCFVYFLYIIFAVPVLFTKISTINKKT